MKSLLLAATLLVIAAAFAVRSDLRDRGARTSPRATGSPGTCKLDELRVARTLQGSGTDRMDEGNEFLAVTFVNVGHACHLGGKYPFAVTATTDTNVPLRANLLQTARFAHGQAKTVGFGMRWIVRHYPGNHHCRRALLTSVMFHSEGMSRSVSLRHLPYPFEVCTPMDVVDIVFMDNPL